MLCHNFIIRCNPFFTTTVLQFEIFSNFTGKVDVGRYPDVAQKYHISTTSLTRQLPTVILFQEGKETGRVPAIISGKVQKFMFKEDEIVNVFDLNNIYSECKKVTFLCILSSFIEIKDIVLQIFYYIILHPFIHELQDTKDINDKMKFGFI